MHRGRRVGLHHQAGRRGAAAVADAGLAALMARRMENDAAIFLARQMAEAAARPPQPTEAAATPGPAPAAEAPAQAGPPASPATARPEVEELELELLLEALVQRFGYDFRGHERWPPKRRRKRGRPPRQQRRGPKSRSWNWSCCWKRWCSASATTFAATNAAR